MEDKEVKFAEKIANIAFVKFGLFYLFLVSSIYFNTDVELNLDILSLGKSILTLLGVSLFACFFGYPNSDSFKDNFIFWLGICSALGVIAIFFII